MDALKFINAKSKGKRQPVYVLSGDEDFLKRHCRTIIESHILGDTDPAYALTVYNGEDLDFSTVRNELDSVSFFSEVRLVIVEQAEDFVTKFRPTLEKYLAQPSSVGVLVLEVKSFPATTKLAKALPEDAHLVCKGPPDYRLPLWCVDWCQTHYDKKIATPASQLLVELVGTGMGQLDQELRKLRDFVGDRPSIEAKDVDELVGKSREQIVFRIMDAVGEGKTEEAVRILVELLDHGEEPMKLLGGLGFQLRKLARVARARKQGATLEDAFAKAGVPNFPAARDAARRQLNHLGMARLEKIHDWLLELNSGLKGGSELPERLQLERLVVRLARPRS
ncbi:DNA polymerase III subunit delta [Zavarzinella formosa]|uniref:DNA polymerase III subunit delta n=1 Tax=Zavarzinella formosa TaxID=360055 RepID=UPI0002EA115C|nr:DNA polymerase III subunit delta [Zavarzinella formosa]